LLVLASMTRRFLNLPNSSHRVYGTPEYSSTVLCQCSAVCGPTAYRSFPSMNISNRTTPPLSHCLLVWLAVALLRILVGFQPHSGQDGYHGSKIAYGGDFEAQRHWMELTLHLPVGKWYWYDVEYWGLDYPPLTAYHSWLCGWFSSVLVGPESVELMESRGYEDPTHKAFMRGTVLVSDLMIFGSAAWVLSRGNGNDRLWSFAFAMTQPALILIDHGHFQYNTVALGLSLWAFFFMTKEGMRNCVIGSVLFCLALFFKQMALYYAPAVGCYLLGRCFSNRRQAIVNFGRLGVTVLVTFAALWWPFVLFGPGNTSYTERLLHVLRRIFPVQRGLFEGKVANLWCALSVKPIRIRDRIAEDKQFAVSLMITLLLILPASYRAFRQGLQSHSTRHIDVLLLAATSSSLAFFLASFQVHEKSLLLSLAPACLMQDPSIFLSFAVAWTMWPLLVIDRLQVAYACTLVMFGSFLNLKADLRKEASTPIWLMAFKYGLPVGLHLAEACVEPPSSLPDLFPVLWSVVGCGIVSLSYADSILRLLRVNASKLKAS